MSLRKMIELFNEETTYSVPGSRYKKQYKLVLNDDGTKYLKTVNEIDVQAEINSHEPSVNIHNIIDRFVNGDIGSIDRAAAFYGDVSSLPVKLQDVLNLVSDGEDVFRRMPLDLREMYGNDYYRFLSNPDILDEYLKKKNSHIVENDVEKEDVKDNETSD